MKRDVFLLGVGINKLSPNQILEYITENIFKNRKKNYIVTPNPEILVIANKNKSYKKVLNNADLALPDGIGIILGAKFLGKPLQTRLSGVDLVEKLCKYVSKRPITVGFLGGRDGIAVATSECLKKLYPSLKVGFAGEKWEVSLSSSTPPNSQLTSHPHLDILFVAFGSPTQELWISKNLPKLPVKVAIGVGGSFDFISGAVPRAPQFLRNFGLEWLFRLILEPWRIKRQIRLLEFILLIIKEKFANINL